MVRLQGSGDWYSLIGMQGWGCWYGLWGWLVRWGCWPRYFMYAEIQLSSKVLQTTLGHLSPQFGDLLHPQSPLLLVGAFSLKVRCQQTPSQNDRLPGHLGVKGEICCWVVVNSARSKEASVVKTEKMWIGLVI